MRGEEHPQQLFLALLDERNPKLRDIEAERDGHAKWRNARAAFYPVDTAEQVENRRLFMAREAKRENDSSQLSVLSSQKKPESIGKKNGDRQERKTG